MSSYSHSSRTKRFAIGKSRLKSRSISYDRESIPSLMEVSKQVELLDGSRPMESLINRIFNVLMLRGARDILNGHKFDS